MGLTYVYGQLGLSGSIITGIIILLFISCFYANLFIRRRYLSLSNELAAYCAGDIDELQCDILIWVTEEYKECLLSGVENVNTHSIIDVAIEAFQKPYKAAEVLLGKINGLLISLGLFGTFLGLTSALGQIGELFSGTSSEALIAEAGLNTFKMLISSFKGMSVAFITSLFGTGLSILFSVLTSFVGYNDAKNLLITELEEYLDIKVAGEVLKEQRENDNSVVEKVLFKDVVESISVFNNTINSYVNDLSFLKDFNQQFKENLTHADNSISNINRSLDRTTEAFDRSCMKMAECSEELKILADAIKHQNSRMDALGMLFTDLSRKLDETSQDRNLFLKTLDEIPDRLLNYTEAAVARIEKGV